MEKEKKGSEEACEAGATGDAPATPETQVPPVEGAGEEVKTGETSETGEKAKAAEPDWKDRYTRLLADFDNFKKRVARDREDTYRFAEADILGDVLPAADNLALALGNAKDEGDEFVKGVRLVYDALVKALADHGCEPFDSVGCAMDPEKMEAIATLPSDTVEEGKVSTEVKRGWTLKGRLLRAAQVVVSSGAAEKKAAE